MLDISDKMVEYGGSEEIHHTVGIQAPGGKEWFNHLSTYRNGADTHLWVDVAAQAAAAKKGEDTVVLDVHEVIAITDAFVITSATSDRHVRALADAVAEAVKIAGGPPLLHSEGYSDARWVLLDYGSFVVHVFDRDTRAYYDLEYLWGNVPREEFEEPELITAHAG